MIARPPLPVCLRPAGLRWNLHNTVMRVGGLISTSNKVQSDEVWVTTDRQVLWMTQVKER